MHGLKGASGENYLVCPFDILTSVFNNLTMATSATNVGSLASWQKKSKIDHL